MSYREALETIERGASADTGNEAQALLGRLIREAEGQARAYDSTAEGERHPDRAPRWREQARILRSIRAALAEGEGRDELGDDAQSYCPSCACQPCYNETVRRAPYL